MKTNKMKGFTLVELLAVIVILAIILVIAVPKVMSVIEDSKKATLESTAKMIASAVEKALVQNTILGKEEEITCKSVAKINDLDYDTCEIKFEDNKAKVTIKGKGKFEGLWICGGTKTNATAQKDGCGLSCNEEEAYVETINITRPYVVKDYDACINYFEPIISDYWNDKEDREGDLIRICKNIVVGLTSLEDLIFMNYFTKEELINNNVIDANSVFKSNITPGDYNSCVNYLKDLNLGFTEGRCDYICTNFGGEDDQTYVFDEYLRKKYFTTEELIENNVVGSDSVFRNIIPGDQNSCVNQFKDIWVNEWGGKESEIQALCRGEHVNVKTRMDEIINDDWLVTELELLENNIIEGSIENEKVCVPSYSNSAVTYINNLYNNSDIRSKFGLTKDNTADENIRYAGQNVQNYVEFGNSGELWRIIGTFKVENSNGKTEELVKIVRNSVFEDENDILCMSWDSTGGESYYDSNSSQYSCTGINCGMGINQWGPSGDYLGSDLMQLLNGYYIGESTTCVYCDLVSQSSCVNSCNNSVKQINSTYSDMVESVVWNTGAVGRSVETPIEAYNAERGTLGKICSSEFRCNDTVERTTTWLGKIGLIYLSDFGYAGGSACSYIQNSECGKTNNWLTTIGMEYNLINSAADDGVAEGVWQIGNEYFVSVESAGNASGVRPSLYLKSNVRIVDGDGSRNNPYKLAM